MSIRSQNLTYLFDPVPPAGQATRRKAPSSRPPDVRVGLAGGKERRGGRLASLIARFTEGFVGDRTLAQRVQAKLEMLVRNPEDISVAVENGHVRLTGPISSDEVEPVLAMIAQVRGVRRVENRLHVHSDVAPDRPVFTDGGRPRRWSSARLMGGLAGGALALLGARRRSVIGAGMAALGLGLLARGLTDTEVSRLIGLRERARRRVGELERRRTVGPDRPDSRGPTSGRYRVRDLRYSPKEVIHPDASLDEAARRMKARHLHAMLVQDGDGLIGIVTDRDVLLSTVVEKRDPRTTAVRAAMKPHVVYCYDDDDVLDVVRRMGEHNLQRVAILDRNRCLVGLLTVNDLMRQVGIPHEPRYDEERRSDEVER